MATDPAIPISDTWPDDGLEPVPRCPLCGSGVRQLRHAGLRDYFFQCAPGQWSLFQCAECGGGYLDPRPTPDTIALAYSTYYTHQTYTVANGLHNRIWRALRDDYLHAAFGVPSTTAVWPGRWLLRLFPIGRQGLDAVLARNIGLLPGEGASLLDVGCGNGNYLEFARSAGWQVRGLDFDPAAVAAARAQGLDVLHGTIELLAGERARYDRITLSHLLEHAYDPWDILSSCHRLLKPGGVLWLDTPNMNSNGLAVFGPYWRGLESPRHLQLFSRKCLMDKLSEIGFSDIQDIYSSFATGAMWGESRTIMAKAGMKKGFGHAIFGQLMAETRALFSPDSREFITLMCVKKNGR